MVRLTVLLSLLVLVPGCAWTNLSSASRRAGTYAPETKVEINPSSGKLSFISTGDDAFDIEEMSIGGHTVKGFKASFERSPVVLAQGQRATAITPLMGQDIEANRIWGDILIGALEQGRLTFEQAIPLLTQMQSSSAQLNMMELQAKIQRQERIIEILSKAQLTVPTPGTISQP